MCVDYDDLKIDKREQITKCARSAAGEKKKRDQARGLLLMLSKTLTMSLVKSPY
jgi:hypothetical protein